MFKIAYHGSVNVSAQVPDDQTVVGQGKHFA
jgi:hypothetical protein